MKYKTVCLFICLLPAVAQAQNADLQACRQITDVNSRVSCYDAIVDAQQARSTASQEAVTTAASPEPDAAAVARDTENVQPQNTVTEQSENLFGRTADASRDFLEREAGVELPDQIEAVISQTSTTAFGKIVVELANGQVWQQIDSARLRLEDGDQVLIRSGRLGAYFLEKSSGSRAIRVRRML